MFYGYLVCNECGGKFRKSQKYYYCNTYSRLRKCTKHSISKEKLIGYVLEDINKKQNKKLNKLDRSILFKIVENIIICDNGDITVKYKK